MKRLYICTIIASDTNQLINFRVPDDCLLSFLEVVINSNLSLTVNKIVDYDRQK